MSEADISMTDAPAPAPAITTTTTPSSKKTHPSTGTSKPHQRLTHRTPPYSYLTLTPTFSPAPPSPHAIDLLTLRSYIASAFRQWHGIAGTAIDVDILHAYSGKEGTGTVLVRVPSRDAAMARAALGGWVGEEGKRSVGFRVGGGSLEGVLGGVAGEEGIWG